MMKEEEETLSCEDRRFFPLSMRTKMVATSISFFTLFFLICSIISPVVFDTLAELQNSSSNTIEEMNSSNNEEIFNLNFLDFDSPNLDLYTLENRGGAITYEDGHVFLKLPAESPLKVPGCSALLSDFNYEQGHPWQYVTVEFRLRCSDDNKLESEIAPLDESLEVMETMDRIRTTWGLNYPGDAI